MELKKISLLKNTNNLINIGLIILSLIIAKNIYTSQVKKIDALKADRGVELKKNALINDISGVEKRISSYKNVLPERDASSIINSVTQIASSSQIKVISVKPEEGREYTAYNEISIKLSIVAPDYHKIGDFISRLENAPELYIINNFFIRPLTQTLESSDADRLSAELTVIAIIFKG